MKALNLIGQTFSRLTVLELLKDRSNKHRKWKCLCICGNTTNVTTCHLRAGAITSCGCLHKEIVGAVIHGHASKKNITLEYTTWANMKSRCYNTNSKDYAYYGAIGITVCDRWKNSFENFFADMGSKPTPKHTLERRDGKDIYKPSNCYWATRKEQALNLSSNVILIWNNQRKTMSEWAEHWNVPYDKFRYLVNKHVRNTHKK